MATSVTQIRIDEDLKNQATAIFEELGLDFPGEWSLMTFHWNS